MNAGMDRLYFCACFALRQLNFANLCTKTYEPGPLLDWAMNACTLSSGGLGDGGEVHMSCYVGVSWRFKDGVVSVIFNGLHSVANIRESMSVVYQQSGA
jgi:hypothetical protein